MATLPFIKKQMTDKKLLIRLILISLIFSYLNGNAQSFYNNVNNLEYRSIDSIEIRYVVSKLNISNSLYVDTLKTK